MRNVAANAASSGSFLSSGGSSSKVAAHAASSDGFLGSSGSASNVAASAASSSGFLSSGSGTQGFSGVNSMFGAVGPVGSIIASSSGGFSTSMTSSTSVLPFVGGFGGDFCSLLPRVPEKVQLA